MLSIGDVEKWYALYCILVSICVTFECLIHIPWLAPWNVYFQHLNPFNVYIQQFNHGMYTFHSLSIECIHSTVLAIECIHSTVIYIQCNIYKTAMPENWRVQQLLFEVGQDWEILGKLYLFTDAILPDRVRDSVTN